MIETYLCAVSPVRGRQVGFLWVCDIPDVFFLYSHSFNFPFGRVPPRGIVWELKNGLRLDCLLNSPEGPWLPQWVEIIYEVIFSCTCIFTDCLKHWCCEIMKIWKFVQGLFLVWMKSLTQKWFILYKVTIKFGLMLVTPNKHGTFILQECKIGEPKLKKGLLVLQGSTFTAFSQIWKKFA